MKSTAKQNFNEKKSNFNDTKAEIEVLFDQSSKLRNKMKILKKKDQIEAELDEKRHQMNNGFLSLQEEKKIIKEIQDLEKSLPHSVPLAAIEDKMD